MSKADIANIAVAVIAVICFVIWIASPGWDLIKVLVVICSAILFLANLLFVVERRRKKKE